MNIESKTASTSRREKPRISCICGVIKLRQEFSLQPKSMGDNDLLMKIVIFQPCRLFYCVEPIYQMGEGDYLGGQGLRLSY